MKKGLKDAVAPQGLFEDLGLKYVGPVDGHDRPAMEQALAQAKKFNGPVIVHAITRKGFGYDAAERHEADQFHQVGPFDLETGEARVQGPDLDRRVLRGDRGASGAERKDVVGHHRRDDAPGRACTPSRPRFPERTFDVGIAEQHAVTSAAGLAMGGLHPVVAIYATFLNRAFDQVLMDVALHRCGVTFVLDRAGVTGDDGASHNGMWDMSILQVVPGLRLAAPRDRRAGPRAAARGGRRRRRPDRAPRSPRARRPTTSRRSARPAARDVLVRKGTADVLLVAVGSMAAVAVDVAGRLGAQGIGVTVVDPRWVKPVDPAIVELAREHRLVVSVEDNGEIGGCGAVLLQTLTEAGVTTPFRLHGIPQEFLGPRQAGPDPRADRPHPAGAGARHRRGDVRPARPDVGEAVGGTPSMPTSRSSRQPCDLGPSRRPCC